MAVRLDDQARQIEYRYDEQKSSVDTSGRATMVAQNLVAVGAITYWLLLDKVRDDVARDRMGLVDSWR